MHHANWYHFMQVRPREEKNIIGKENDKGIKQSELLEENI